MTVAAPRASPRPTAGRTGFVGAAVALAALAFLVRLLPVLRGGGLDGLGNYDDGVYYAAGTALAHGRLPYADFLLLHPPGVVLALAPFGLLGRLVGDPAGLAAARLTWMALGAFNTVLVVRILRPANLGVAAFGGLVYAVSYPAVYTEWTTSLEAPAQTCVLLALLVLRPQVQAAASRGLRADLPVVLGGVLVGLSAGVKIWGAATLVAVVVWSALRRRWRDSLLLLLGGVGAVTVVCLPFFLAAPGAMWRMVVLDQLTRGRSTTPPATRLHGILGLGLHGSGVAGSASLLVVAVVVLGGLLVVAVLAVPAARLAAVLVVVHVAVLLAGPSWFLHYPAFATGPLVVVVAAGAGEIVRRTRAVHPVLGTGLALLLGAAVVLQAVPLAGLRLGTRFPGASLASAVRATPGCVSSDDPAALAAMGVLGRDLDRGCPFVADLGGYSYELTRERGAPTPRAEDDRWQQAYLGQLRTGAVTLSFRYAPALSASSRATVRSWPRVAGTGPYVLRRPAGG